MSQKEKKKILSGLHGNHLKDFVKSIILQTICLAENIQSLEKPQNACCA
jgi:hypothetical protein